MESVTTKTADSPHNVFSETQKKKAHHLFNVLDIDRNGRLQPSDFINVGKKIIYQLKLNENTRSARLILLKSHRLYVQLLTDLENPDLNLTLWDWMAFFRDQIESDEQGILDHYIHNTSRHLFDLFDMNKDKLISREEYALMLDVYNISETLAMEGFDELDTNEDNFISSDEMVRGLQNFFRSGEEDAEGNLIFGPWR